MDRLEDGRLPARRTQLQRATRPLHVVERGILGEHPAEMPLPGDHHLVGDFGSNRQ
jgi:hypothetical protein